MVGMTPHTPGAPIPNDDCSTYDRAACAKPACTYNEVMELCQILTDPGVTVDKVIVDSPVTSTTTTTTTTKIKTTLLPFVTSPFITTMVGTTFAGTQSTPEPTSPPPPIFCTADIFAMASNQNTYATSKPQRHCAPCCHSVCTTFNWVEVQHVLVCSFKKSCVCVCVCVYIYIYIWGNDGSRDFLLDCCERDLSYVLTVHV